MSLYLFDLDGTLIDGYLKRVPCDCYEMTPECGGYCGGCERCNQRGYRLERTQDYATITWLPNRLRRLRALSRRGHDIGIVTNQTGVTWGHQTAEEVHYKNERVLGQLESIVPRPFIRVCTDAHDTHRRKPGPGMIFEGMTYALYPTWETTFIGDMDTDYQAALAARVAYCGAETFFG